MQDCNRCCPSIKKVPFLPDILLRAHTEMYTLSFVQVIHLNLSTLKPDQINDLSV